MKITKYLHSCILLEEGERTILIDPGNNAYEEKIFPFENIVNLDYIFITHEHMDHMHLPFIKELLVKFPQVQIVTNDQAIETLKKGGVSSTSVIPDFVSAQLIPHEQVFGMGHMCENSEFTFMNLLTHPGDSFHSKKTAKIFALPLQAPWGDVTEAITLVENIMPEIVIPIHDWHWKDKVRLMIYARVESYLKSKNITFIPLETGRSVEIS